MKIGRFVLLNNYNRREMMPECDCSRKSKERQYLCNFTGIDQDMFADEVISMLRAKNCTNRDIRYVVQAIIKKIQEEK